MGLEYFFGTVHSSIYIDLRAERQANLTSLLIYLIRVHDPSQVSIAPTSSLQLIPLVSSFSLIARLFSSVFML